MRLKTAMRQNWNAIGTFRSCVSFLECFFGIARGLLPGGSGPVADLGQIFFEYQVRHHLVIHFDEANRIVGDFFRGRSQKNHLLTGPL